MVRCCNKKIIRNSPETAIKTFLPTDVLMIFVDTIIILCKDNTEFTKPQFICFTKSQSILILNYIFVIY